ncbi:type I restriction-modification system subunit M [Methanosarcina sp. Mfa9]|uniref:type I restriction-modification system subunit M n=1 Tax=Methanosarcina sp. Mfa9 TaxID=3439063 RepID=UPI003F841794
MSKITLSELEQNLWGAANILRGPVDASDFKSYIFPLLFFKRISDVYDEEFKEAMEDSGDEEYAELSEFHDFIIPHEAHWDDVKEKTENVGQALQKAFREIEKSNPHTLYGIFGDVNWTNKDRLSDELLIDLIQHFDPLKLSKSNVEPDILGQAYEYLIKKFADLTNRKAGEFYTPRPVVHLMGSILKPQEQETIYDPACGSGGMLLESYHYVQKSGGDSRTIKLYGQEKNLTTSSISRINLFLHDIKEFQIHRGDTLKEPYFHEGDRISQFDVVIANPPFSLKNWGHENWSHDPFGRNLAGTPPKSNGDYAWVQHMITSMKPETGRMAIVLPHGALFRQGAEGRIRKELIEKDLLEAVIGLGPNLFYGTGISACILVFRSKKTEEKENKVLFIDASEQYQKGRNQNFFLPEHAETVLQWYENFGDLENISQVVELSEIRKNEYNLNIPLYVKKVHEVEEIDLKATLEHLKADYEAFLESEEKMKQLLKEVNVL